jgi:hypothetical protein
VSRLTRTLLLAAVTFCLIAPSASAAPGGELLGDLWTTLLETPGAENPFNTGEPSCVDLRGNTVAPFMPAGFPPQDFTCTVRRGTKIFVAGSTFECSSFVPGDHVGFGTTEAELRECARQHDAQAPAVTVDGRSVSTTAVETRLLRIHLPRDNVFGVTGADRRGRSVAHGWVVLLKRLARGTHTIRIEVENEEATITTTIIVK